MKVGTNKKEEQKQTKKTKTYAFWMSTLSAVLLCVVQILAVFGVFVETKQISDIISGILGALVVAGILIGPVKTKTPQKNSPNKDE